MSNTTASLRRKIGGLRNKPAETGDFAIELFF